MSIKLSSNSTLSGINIMDSISTQIYSKILFFSHISYCTHNKFKLSSGTRFGRVQFDCLRFTYFPTFYYYLISTNVFSLLAFIIVALISDLYLSTSIDLLSSIAYDPQPIRVASDLLGKWNTTICGFCSIFYCKVDVFTFIISIKFKEYIFVDLHDCSEYLII